MYIRSYHQESDPQVVLQFMRDQPFASLVSYSDPYPAASHIPIEVLGDQVEGLKLMGHIARANPQLSQLSAHPEVLVIFLGPSSYVSASWYPVPDVASTWNYIAVHAQGTLRLVDPETTLDHLRRLTHRHESGVAHPTAVDRMPKDYIRKNLQAIQGFEILVERLDNTYKLSQNKDEQTRSQVIEELSKSNDARSRQIAAEMARRDSLGPE